jgi:hypothetical protein
MIETVGEWQTPGTTTDGGPTHRGGEATASDRIINLIGKRLGCGRVWAYQMVNSKT